MKTTLIFSLLALSLQANARGATQGGRFQLVQLSDMRRDQYLIDTDTGKLWSSICFHATGVTSGDENCVMAWQEVPVIGLNSSIAKVRKMLDEKSN